MQSPKRGRLETAAFVIGMLGLIGLAGGYLLLAFGYSSGLMGFFAALTIIGFFLAYGEQRFRRIIGSLLMLTVGALGFGILSYIPEINKEIFGAIGVMFIIFLPALVYMLSGILALVIVIKESGKSK